MSKMPLSIPYEILGDLRDTFESELNEALKSASSTFEVGYFEVNLQAQNVDEIREYTITGGQVGERIRFDEDDVAEVESSEPNDDISEGALIDHYVRKFYDELNDKLTSVIADQYDFVSGVGLLLINSVQPPPAPSPVPGPAPSPNITYICSGMRGILDAKTGKKYCQVKRRSNSKCGWVTCGLWPCNC